jgi:hypothetical protein
VTGGTTSRGAAAAAPGTGPLAIISAAVAGDDLPAVARSAAEALGCPVVIALPALTLTVTWPADATVPADLARHAEAVARSGDVGRAFDAAAAVEAVPVRLGSAVLGIVAVLGTGVAGDARPWLEAAAAAAAVTALMPGGRTAAEARRELLRELESADAVDVPAVVAQARALGFDLSGGGTAFCLAADGRASPLPGELLAADVGGGRVLGVACGVSEVASTVARLRESGMTVVAAAPRSDPAGLAEALREAAVLLELAVDPRAMFAAHEDTYRLLVGVLLHDPDELQRLRAGTIDRLEAYDADHDAALVATLETFLAHHGSTTDTAEAMSLHRHTVGYRLARVHEVSLLSPYESDGRERLSLGLKAHRILAAEARRRERAR